MHSVFIFFKMRIQWGYSKSSGISQAMVTNWFWSVQDSPSSGNALQSGRQEDLILVKLLRVQRYQSQKAHTRACVRACTHVYPTMYMHSQEDLVPQYLRRVLCVHVYPYMYVHS